MRYVIFFLVASLVMGSAHWYVYARLASAMTIFSAFRTRRTEAPPGSGNMVPFENLRGIQPPTTSSEDDGTGTARRIGR